MAKKRKIVKVVKLQIPAGKANPAPPVGPALGAAGINIMAFCKEFNARTQKDGGDILPVVIEVYEDKSFSFITKKPPVPVLIKKQLNLKSGSKEPGRTSAGKMTMSQARQVAEQKMEDMVASSIDAATLMVAGTARSMGIEVVEG